MAKSIILISAIILLSIFGNRALLHKGLLPTHDGEYHVVRFYEFNKTFISGNLYPRWQPDLNNGFGSPLPNYHYPLPNYVASLFHAVGFSFIDSFKLEMLIASIIGGIFFYLWTKMFWGEAGAMVSSIVYSFSPYHFVEVIVRGSIGEVWALAFFPAFLWAITKVIIEKNKRFSLLSGFFLFLIIISHNILAYMFFPFALFYAIALFFMFKAEKKIVVYVFIAFLLGLLHSAIFWMPALLEKGYVIGLQIFDPTQNFPEAYQLIFPSWGTGFSGDDLSTQLSFQLGIVNTLGVFASGICLLDFIKNRTRAKIVVYFLLWFAIVLFLMLPQSSIVWKTLPLMSYFQFPWRLLSLEILITAFLTGSIFLNTTLRKSPALTILISGGIILLTIVLTTGYSMPAYYMERADSYYFTKPNFMDGTNTPGNAFNTIWLNTSLKRRKTILENSDIDVFNQSIMPTSYVFNAFSKKDTNVTINTAYFPGWKAYIDRKEVKIVPSKDGLITFPIIAGKHIISVYLGETNIQIAARTISLISFSIIILFLVFGKNFKDFYETIQKNK